MRNLTWKDVNGFQKSLPEKQIKNNRFSYLCLVYGMLQGYTPASYYDFELKNWINPNTGKAFICQPTHYLELPHPEDTVNLILEFNEKPFNQCKILMPEYDNSMQLPGGMIRTYKGKTLVVLIQSREGEIK